MCVFYCRETIAKAAIGYQAILTRRVICPLLSQYVILLTSAGSSAAGWILPSTSIALDVMLYAEIVFMRESQPKGGVAALRKLARKLTDKQLSAIDKLAQSILNLPH